MEKESEQKPSTQINDSDLQKYFAELLMNMPGISVTAEYLLDGARLRKQVTSQTTETRTT